MKSESDNSSKIILALKKIPVFKGISDRDYNALIKILHIREYENDEYIFKSGTPGLGMYIVVKGEVHLSGIDVDGKKVEISKLSTGDSFGEISLVSEEYRSTDAIAISDCNIVSFFRSDLLDIITRSPKLGNKILLNLATILGDRLINTNKLLIGSELI